MHRDAFLRIFLCGIAAFCLTACSDDEDAHPKPDQPPRYMLYSPNGEPLNGGPLGKLTCEKAVSGWFDRMSSGGHISQSAFIADAKIQFARMDIDHNGYIVSEELDRFRAPYRQEPETPKDDSPGWMDKVRTKDRHIRSDPSLSMSDPVMSADTNLDFKVTSAEFLNQAHDVFARLNTGHDGELTRAQALIWCDEKQSGEKKD